MKLLAIDCSATAGSAAVLEDGKVIASAFISVKLTHSQTLLPMVENILKCAGLTLADIDAFAVNSGPGSFTGVRIGISAVKGMAAPGNKPCIAVSTLHSIAYNFKNTDCTVCAVMDARCSQVYNALFRVEKGAVTRLCNDRAVMKQDVEKELEEIGGNIIVAGDGAALFEDFAAAHPGVRVAAEPLRQQNATGVGLAAGEKLKAGETVSADALLPFYLRLPQAERELKAKSLKGE